MPITPYTYLDLQILFQDSYEASTNKLGIEYILSTDIILNYLYEAELQIIHELASNKQYDLLKGYTTVQDISIGLVLTPVLNVYESENIEFDYYIKSYSNILSVYNGVGSFNGLVENELIPKEDAGLYYQTAFNIPYFKSPKIYTEAVNTYNSPESTEKKFVIIVDGYTILNNLVITTIKLPSVPTTSTKCFSDYTLYNKIVDIAVNKAISNLAKLSSNNNKDKE